MQNTDSQTVGDGTLGGGKPDNTTQDELLELLLGMLRKEAMNKVIEVREKKRPLAQRCYSFVDASCPDSSSALCMTPLHVSYLHTYHPPVCASPQLLS